MNIKDCPEIKEIVTKIKEQELEISSIKSDIKEIKEILKNRKEKIIDDNECYYSVDYLNDNFDESELGKVIDTINTAEEFKNFIDTHKLIKDSAVSYKGIKLGNIIKIKVDNFQSEDWIVVDFFNDNIGLFPTANILKAAMNDSNTTFGGFENSKMFKETIPYIIECIVNITNKTRYTKISLLDEYELFGERIYQIEFNREKDDEYVKSKQLSLFKHISLKELVDKGIFSREDFWLRGVASSADFCLAHGSGTAVYFGASTSFGVRPLIYVG